MENKLRHIIREIISEELNEMAAIPKLLKIGDATKLEQAKRLYDDETFWVRKMIDAVEAAGETGVPRMLYKEKGNEGRSIDGLTNIIDKGQQLVNPKVADFIDIGLFVEFGSVIPKKIKSTEVGKRGRPAKSTDGMVAVRNAMNSEEELEDMNDESFDPLVYDDDEDKNPPLNEWEPSMQYYFDRATSDNKKNKELITIANEIFPEFEGKLEDFVPLTKEQRNKVYKVYSAKNSKPMMNESFIRMQKLAGL